jgi:hypothetical protein
MTCLAKSMVVRDRARAACCRNDPACQYAQNERCPFRSVFWRVRVRVACAADCTQRDSQACCSEPAQHASRWSRTLPTTGQPRSNAWSIAAIQARGQNEPSETLSGHGGAGGYAAFAVRSARAHLLSAPLHCSVGQCLDAVEGFEQLRLQSTLSLRGLKSLSDRLRGGSSASRSGVVRGGDRSLSGS